MPIERLTREFHETYERLAPDFGYKTREASAVPWDDVPEQNKALMRAVVAHVMGAGAVSLLDDLADVLADVRAGTVPADGSVVRDVLKRAIRHANGGQ